MMRMADADLLPFNFVDFADDVQKYGRDLTQLASQGKLDPVIGRDQDQRQQDHDGQAGQMPVPDRAAGG